MHASRPEILVYWGPRRETARQCAVKFSRMLANLQTVHPVFSRWYYDGFAPTRQNRDPSTPLPGLDELEAVFDASKHYKDVPREPIPELGYLFGGGNGRDDGESLSFRVAAGAWYDGGFFPNNFNIHLHWLEVAEGDWANAVVLGATLRAIVTAWDA
ncbi:MAG TPA: Imm52 family immunity protein, partial [Beijerinckiaceae bacterium]|nr:Imm52 family immunity protein [Beijerinckiaceae bacterium]